MQTNPTDILMNASIPELVWTASSVAAVILYLMAVRRIIRKYRMLKQKGQNGAIALMYTQKIVLRMGLGAAYMLFTIMGVAAMSVPPPIRSSNELAADLFAYAFITVNVAGMLFGVFDMWVTEKIEAEVNKPKAWGGEERRAADE